MKCSELMTSDPTVCDRDTDCATVARQMREANVGAIPIVSSRNERKLEGILTDRDLCLRVVAEDLRPGEVKAQEVMSGAPLYCCRPDDDVERAVELMEQHQIRRVPVCDEEMRVLGIIAQGDLSRHQATRDKVTEVIEHVSRPTSPRQQRVVSPEQPAAPPS